MANEEKKLDILMRQYFKMHENLKDYENRTLAILTCCIAGSAAVVAFGGTFSIGGVGVAFWFVPVFLLIGGWGYTAMYEKISILIGYLSSLETAVNREINLNALLWYGQLFPNHYKDSLIHKVSYPLFTAPALVGGLFCIKQLISANERWAAIVGVIALAIFLVICICLFIKAIKIRKNLIR